MSNLLSIKQAAEYLNVSEETLRRWDRSGKLLSVKTEGGHRRYQKETMDEYIGIITESEEKIESVATYSRVSSHEQVLKLFISKRMMCLRKKNLLMI